MVLLYSLSPILKTVIVFIIIAEYMNHLELQRKISSVRCLKIAPLTKWGNNQKQRSRRLTVILPMHCQPHSTWESEGTLVRVPIVLKVSRWNPGSTEALFSKVAVTQMNGAATSFLRRPSHPKWPRGGLRLDTFQVLCWEFKLDFKSCLYLGLGTLCSEVNWSQMKKEFVFY